MCATRVMWTTYVYAVFQTGVPKRTCYVERST